jgi:phospholipid/cholesterol/gamma-HCH transport system ATP-binding protein
MPQLVPSPGLPERQAVQRRMDRVMSILPTLPTAAQEAILSEVDAADLPQDPSLAQTQPTDPEREPEAAERQAEWATTDQAAQAAEEEDQEEQDKPHRWPPHWPGGGG